MELQEVMTELAALGTEQARKIYARHGAVGEIFGVSYANLKKLHKKIKVDHSLAQQLWATGNNDARVLALMIADPHQANEELLDGWVGELRDYGLASAVAGYVARTPLAQAKAVEWICSDEEYVGQAGWDVLGSLALYDKALDDSFFLPYLEQIAATIHERKNRVRYAMNNALIAIGGRNDTLAERALAVAAQVGKVQVDHGQTSCKTPDAAPYINKMRARKVTAA